MALIFTASLLQFVFGYVVYSAFQTPGLLPLLTWLGSSSVYLLAGIVSSRGARFTGGWTAIVTGGATLVGWGLVVSGLSAHRVGGFEIVALLVVGAAAIAAIVGGANLRSGSFDDVGT